MKKIVVTTDLSSESRLAFPLAREMARAFGASIILLLVSHEITAVPAAFGLEAPVYFDQSVQKEIDERLRKDLVKLRDEEFPDGSATVLLKSGSLTPVDGIIEEARTLKPDLLIMSSHGRSGIQRALLGSITERVIREAPCPVLVVPARA